MHEPYVQPSASPSRHYVDVSFTEVPMARLVIVFVAMVQGALFYLGFVFYMHDKAELSFRWHELSVLEHWFYCFEILVASFVVPWLISKVGSNRIRQADSLIATKIFDLYQVQWIIGVGLLMSVAFYGAFWFSESKNLAFLVIGALFLVVIALRFPSRRRLQRWWIYYQPVNIYEARV